MQMIQGILTSLHDPEDPTQSLPKQGGALTSHGIKMASETDSNRAEMHFLGIAGDDLATLLSEIYHKLRRRGNSIVTSRSINPSKSTACSLFTFI